MRHTHLTTTIAVALMASPAIAQEKTPPTKTDISPEPTSPPPRIAPRRFPPRLFVRRETKMEPLKVSRVAIEALVTGFVARTTMTVTFDNPNDRPMEGELDFPLPEGAVVASYGLDIGGEIVDASIVEKERARVAFEAEVRKGIDPGLVEWTQGNAFRTRVFPIPAQGKRTVRVEYVSDLAISGGQAIYQVPLAFEDKVAQFSLKVEVVKGPAEPRIAGGGLANFQFKKWEDRYVAEATLTDVAAKDDLRIELPNVQRKNVLVEKRVENGRDAFYFLVADLPRPRAATATMRSAKKPKRIGILWDASLSRARVDVSRELGILEKVLASLANVDVDVAVLRNVVDKPKSFRVSEGQAGDVIRYLKGAPRDGGTDLRRLRVSRGRGFWLLFSDGLSTLSEAAPDELAEPVYALNAAVTANHAFLRAIARKSGGEYFNLGTVADDDVVRHVMAGPDGETQFLGAEFDKHHLADVTPNYRQPVGERFGIAGRLLVPEATIKLSYGRGNEPDDEVTYTLKQEGAGETGLVARYFAQQKVQELALFADKNRAELLDLGREFHLVTPATSLLVLETLEQHIEHKVTPAKSRADLYAKYMEAMSARAADREKARVAKIDKVIKMWDERVEWWNTKFKYPKNFRFRDGETDKMMDVATGGAVVGAALSRPRPVMRSTRRERAPEAPAPAEAAKKEKKASAEGESAREAAITVKAWDPETPYLAAMKKAAGDETYAVYLREREKYFHSPAFYLDCAEFFFARKQKALGLRILTNIAELKLENAALLRIVAHKADQVGETDLAVELFEQVRGMRPEEPQSHRDLALVLAGRGRAAKSRTKTERAADVTRALDLLNQVVLGTWNDRFPEIEAIALVEANAIVAEAARAKLEVRNPLDERLVKLLDVDVRILLTWHTDLTDMDLWVTEPSREKCDYSHNRTTIGGRMSNDFTQGYGPEEYMVRRAMPGDYKIQVNFYGSSQVTLTGGTTVQVTVITNFGRKNEKRKSITMRLQNKTEVIDVGSIAFGD